MKALGWMMVRKGVAVDELATLLGVSVRTAYRCMTAARPVIAEVERTARNRPPAAPSPALTDREGVAAVIGLLDSELVKNEKHRAVVEPAIDKLLAGISVEMSDKLIKMGEMYQGLPAAGVPDDRVRERTVMLALADRLLKLRIDPPHEGPPGSKRSEDDSNAKKRAKRQGDGREG
jgi:hypothetical protein